MKESSGSCTTTTTESSPGAGELPQLYSPPRDGGPFSAGPCSCLCRYYPYHYAPFLSDIKKVSGLKLTFDLGKPFMPFQQLLAVLPAASMELLPEAYRVRALPHRRWRVFVGIRAGTNRRVGFWDCST